MGAGSSLKATQRSGGSVKPYAGAASYFVEKFFDPSCVAHRIERQQIRVGETQRDRRPDACQRRVAKKARIRESRYPLVRVKRGVVNAVRPLKSHIDNWNADEVEKDGVVGARADARVDRRIGHACGLSH